MWLVVCALPERFYPQTWPPREGPLPGPLAASGILFPAMSTLDLLLEASRPGVTAAGDVRSGSVKRVASAVGEGSMVVQFVHEYLKEI